jgi:hypothetical protein
MVAAANLVEVAALVGDTARATMLAALMGGQSLTATELAYCANEVPPRHRPCSARDEALRFARSCYDHLAGQAGVAVTDALVAMGHIVLTDEGGGLTSSGERFLCELGADLMPRPGSRRLFCQPCLDWTERRYHLKGLAGAAILRRLLELGWFERASGSRALRLTSSGRAGLSEIFQIELDEKGGARGGVEVVSRANNLREPM